MVTDGVIQTSCAKDAPRSASLGDGRKRMTSETLAAGRPRGWRTSMLALMIALVMALAASVWVAGPALAYSFEYDTATSRTWDMGRYLCVENGGVPSAVGCFESNGDYIDVGDTAVDSQSAGVQWKTDYGRSGLCVNDSG